MKEMGIVEYEDRKMERFSLDLAGLLSANGRSKEEVWKLQTVDICAGGALLQTTEDVPLGTEISVNLILPLDRFEEIKTQKALIEVSGKVIRKGKIGTAVCFNDGYKISPIDN